MVSNALFNINIPTPLQEITDPDLKKYGVKLFLKREDLIHPLVSGNKWRKLKYNLIEAKKQGKSTLISFGGAYSNHLYALAAAGKIFGFHTIGVVRGEKTLPLNPTLQFASLQGMIIEYMNREKYRNKESPETLHLLSEKYGDAYFIPEGGTNHLAVEGCKEIIQEIESDYDCICCPCGTSGTISGLIATSPKKVLGFSALKALGLHEKMIGELIPLDKIKTTWEINYQYHFGGYGKLNKDLLLFINKFEVNNSIQLEPIYNGKMMFGIYDLIKKEYFKKGERIIALHTGGLQGLQGLQSQIQKVLSK